MRNVPRLLVLISALTLALGCGGGEQHSDSKTAKAPIPVSVIQVETREGQSFNELLGTVVARQRADVQTKIQARVERIPVGIGSRVRKGDLLIEFDTRETGARVQQARAMHEQTAQDLKRFEILLTQSAATQQEYDGVKARKLVAEAALQEAEAMLTYARISAPFSGTITRKDINEGDLAVPGRPLFTIEDESSLQLVVSVAESQREHLRIGDTLNVGHASGGATIPAIVEELSPSADPITRSLTAKLSLGSDDRLHAGQVARLLIPGSRNAELVLPEEAVVRRGQLELVYAVDDGGLAALKLIRTGRRADGMIEVLSGLRGGERVVVNPPALLEDRDPVEVQP
jgi:RND family efflux transporter MFP subunit